jgi:hypothetical protein
MNLISKKFNKKFNKNINQDKINTNQLEQHINEKNNSNIVIIDNEKPLLYKFNENNDLIYLNNDNECIICSQNLTIEDIILINNLCKCYNATLICRNCLNYWISNNNKCFICSEIYNISYKNRFKIYHPNKSKLLKYNKEYKTDKKHVSLDINSDNSIDSDILVTNISDTNYLLYLCNKIKLLFLNHRLLLLQYLFCSSLAIFIFISVYKTIEYQKMVDNEEDDAHTHTIIW